MKVSCSNCGAQVDTDKSVVECPYCGRQIFVPNMAEQQPQDGVDNYFDNLNTTCQMQYSPVVEQMAQMDVQKEKRVRKMMKNVTSASVVLLVFLALRFIFGLVVFDNITMLQEALPNYLGTIVYEPLSNYVILGIAETFIHLPLFICALVLVIFAKRAQKVDRNSPNFASAYKTVYIISCVMLTLFVVYTIIEICAIPVANNLNDCFTEDVVDLTLSTSSFVWLIILLSCAISCFVNSLKLAKSNN